MSNMEAFNKIMSEIGKQLNEETITAIKAALEVKDEPVVWNEGVPAMLPKQKEGETFIVSYEPNQEAKDEPLQSVWNTLPSNKDIEDAMQMNRLQQLSTPPRRPWVGLTRDEILEARWHNKSSYKFARVLEDKLKGKNT